MNFHEYCRYDGLGLADLVSKGQISPQELLDIAVARMQEVNPLINAVVIDMTQIAKERIANDFLAGPFAGVPFLLKNLEQQYQGAFTDNGSAAIQKANIPSKVHAPITQRWLDAGVVIFGQTNAPEFGLLPFTEPKLHGPTCNPWDLRLTPGGSSGGAAAAVAAGIVPMAGANDAGGSIRGPAAVCGLFGFKPGRGITPWGPYGNDMLHGAALNHVITRSVRDSAAMLDVSCTRKPARPYLEEVSREPKPLRIGFWTQSPLGMPISYEAQLAVNEAAGLLESLDHHVEEAQPIIDYEALFEDVLILMCANTAAITDFVLKTHPSKRADFEFNTRILAKLGKSIGADEYLASLRRWQDHQDGLRGFFSKYDVYITPALACSAPLIGAFAINPLQQLTMMFLQSLGLSRSLMKSASFAQIVRQTLQFSPFTMLANLTGIPAMSVPLHWTAENMPLGVQLMADQNQEGLLFQLAGQLEKVQPWFDRIPMLCGDKN